MPYRNSLALLFLWLTLICNLVLVPKPLNAWGVVAHECIGELAQQHLNDVTLQALKKLSGAPVDLAAKANWADQIKVTRPETRPWHYITIPIQQAYLDTAIAPKPNLAEALVRFSAELSDTSRDAASRWEALKWLVHLIGDLHQPLHVGEREDRGGNEQKVYAFGKESNLHAFFDYGFIEGSGLTRKKIMSQFRQKCEIEPKACSSVMSGSPLEWLDSTHQLSADLYHDSGITIDPKVEHVLSKEYLKRANDLILRQIGLSGLRLAFWLNHLLSTPQVKQGFASEKKAWDSTSTVPQFAWSKNSKVYHRFDCKSVMRIKPRNLQRSAKTPENLKAHAPCLQGSAK